MTITFSRRKFLATFTGASAWPFASRAQQREQIRRVAVLRTTTEDDLDRARFANFQQEMQKLGWIEGRNVTIDLRYASGGPDRIDAAAAELVATAPDVIVTTSNQGATVASRHTRTIPIVMAGAGDPVGTGLVTNMARPGGNITGFSMYEVSIGGKWLELLTEIVPRLSRIGLIYTPGGPGSLGALNLIERLAPTMGIGSTEIPASNGPAIDNAIKSFVGGSDRGLIVLPGPAVGVYRTPIIEAALRYRLPAVYSNRYLTIEGGLLAYSADGNEVYRRAASYVDRILKGEKPGDLPVQLPTKFELVVNLKTAKAIGLTIPESFLLRADQVIE